jgi:alpha-ketoglutarate-dependent taurine dioxygenase
VPLIQSPLSANNRALRVEGRTATHVNDYALDKSSTTGNGDRVRLLDMGDEPPYATHPRVIWPVIRPYLQSGRPIVCVSELHTSHVSGPTSAESERLVHDLFRHLHDPRALYSHHWREGDLVVWGLRKILSHYN